MEGLRLDNLQRSLTTPTTQRFCKFTGNLQPYLLKPNLQLQTQGETTKRSTVACTMRPDQVSAAVLQPDVLQPVHLTRRIKTRPATCRTPATHTPIRNADFHPQTAVCFHTVPHRPAVQLLSAGGVVRPESAARPTRQPGYLCTSRNSTNSPLALPASLAARRPARSAGGGRQTGGRLTRTAAAAAGRGHPSAAPHCSRSAPAARGPRSPPGPGSAA